MPTTTQIVKNIRSYTTGEFLGSARVTLRNVKHQAPRGAGPVFAGQLLNDSELKRLGIHSRELVFAE